MKMLKSDKVRRRRNRSLGLLRLTWLKPSVYKLCFYITICLLSFASISFADDYHYNSILIGDRAVGMGGAYVAISDDPSGLYYNPAGIVFSMGRSLSASVNAFQTSTKLYKDVLGGNGWERKSSNLLPNYFGIIQPLGSGKIGFSYAVPDSRLEDQDQTFYNLPGRDPVTGLPLTITRYVINMNDMDYTYNFGPSYALKINDWLSLGTTLYVHYRDRKLINNQLLTVDDGRYEWSNTYNSLTEWGVKPIVGIIVAPMDKVSVGFTLSKNHILNTDRRLQTTARGLNYGSTTPDYNVWKSTSNREYPVTATLGAAYFPSESLIVSADISYYSATSYTLTYKNAATGATLLESVSLTETINAAVGTEYYLNEKIALRGGLFTNMANTPTLSSGRTDQLEHVDMYGASLSVSSFTRSSSLTIGGSYSYGTGQGQVFPGSSTIQNVEMQNLMAFISAAFSY